MDEDELTPQSGQPEDEKIQDDIYWHAGFFAAMQYELMDYENDLEFIYEYPLSKEALKIDVIIIENKSGVKIEKDIGGIFRKYNILEYKSETDYVSIDDYYKVIAYACLYKAFNHKAAIGQITLTFAAYKYPEKLINHLVNERLLAVSGRYKGIYYVEGELFPIQIIVNNKDLPADGHIFLRGLRRNWTLSDFDKISYALYKAGKTNIRLAYIDALTRANKILRKEIMGMGYVPDIEEIEQSYSIKFFTDALKRVFEKKGWMPDYMADYVKKINEEAKAKVDAAKAKADAANAKADAAEAKAGLLREIEERAIEQVKSMLAEGMSVDEILKISVLPKDKIEEIASQLVV